MPRKHRAARERSGPPEPLERPRGGFLPEWAQIPGVVVQQVSGEAGKAYRCPGCEQLIRAGLPHLVVVEEGNVEGRRHWHPNCWRSELRRQGFHRRDDA